MKKITMLLLPVLFLLFQGCGSEKEIDTITQSQKEIFSYFPSDTQFIMYMNLTELRKTEFWNDYFKPSVTSDTANNWLTGFEEATGTGLKKGISEIITATTWDGNDVFAVRFDSSIAEVHNYFDSAKQFVTQEIAGQKIYTLNEGANAKFYFPTADLLLILKDESYLEDLINNKHKSLKDNDEILQVVQKIKDKKHYWLATNKGGFAAGLLGLLSGNKEMPVKNVIASVTQISLSAHFSDGVDITSVWGCTDSKNAHQLSAGVRSAVAMDILAGKDNAVNELLKKLEITRQEKDVYFEINLDQEQLAGIRKLAEKKKLSQTL